MPCMISNMTEWCLPYLSSFTTYSQGNVHGIVLNILGARLYAQAKMIELVCIDLLRTRRSAQLKMNALARVALLRTRGHAQPKIIAPACIDLLSSPYCATWNKGVRLLSVLELWPIVETSVVSENYGTTVRQTVAHTIHLWPHGLGTPCGSRFSRRKTHD